MRTGRAARGPDQACKLNVGYGRYARRSRSSAIRGSRALLDLCSVSQARRATANQGVGRELRMNNHDR